MNSGLVLLLLSILLAAVSGLPEEVLPLVKLVEDCDDPIVKTPITEQYFDQKLDHFDPANDRYWKQRYFVNNWYHKPGGPAFLYIGLEAPLGQIEAEKGAWLEYAKYYKAIGFAVEHRYYGKSRPTPDQSTANMKYLTPNQALEDLATFITDIRVQYNLTTVKWVAFGGSYGGQLATYMRYKFPHLIDGAVAHSTPLEPARFSRVYMENVGTALRQFPGCYEVMESAFHTIHADLQSDAGVQRLKNTYNVCDFDRNNPLDVAAVLIGLWSLVSGTVQNNDVHIGYATGQPTVTVNTMCKMMLNTSVGAPTDRLVAYTHSVYPVPPGNPCANTTFAAFAARQGVTTWSMSPERSFSYQQCSGLGYYAVTTGATNQPFGGGVDPSFYLSLCQSNFGPQFNRTLFDRGDRDLAINFAGLDIPVTNVIFTQGTVDPWHTYGFMQPPNPRTRVIVIPGGGHIGDMLASSPQDSAALTNARRKIKRAIGQLILGSTSTLIG